jgi:hypothetical protein
MEMEAQPKVRIKGVREGLLVTLEEEDWSEARAALLDQVQARADFLRGGRLILDVGNHILRAAELGQLRDALSEQGVALWAVLSYSPITQQTAQTLGMATRLNRPAAEKAARPLETSLVGDTAVLVRRTLRSGFSVQHTGQWSSSGTTRRRDRRRRDVHGALRARCTPALKAMTWQWCALIFADPIGIAGRSPCLPAAGKPQPEMAPGGWAGVIAVPWSPKQNNERNIFQNCICPQP